MRAKKEITPADEVSQRVLEVIELLKVKKIVKFNIEVSRTCKFSQQYITDLKKGKFAVSNTFVASFCKSYEVNEDYIWRGRLPIFGRDIKKGLYVKTLDTLGINNSECNFLPIQVGNANVLISCPNAALEPRYIKGDLLACRKISIECAELGQTYIIKTTHDVFYLGKLTPTESGIVIKPINPQYIEIPMLKEDISELWQICGGIVYE